MRANQMHMQARSEASRKVVNSIVQGSAADIIKAAMIGWEAWCGACAAATAAATATAAAPATTSAARGAATACLAAPASCAAGAAVGVGRSAHRFPASLVGVIHDELLVECDGDPGTVSKVRACIMYVCHGWP